MNLFFATDTNVYKLRYFIMKKKIKQWVKTLYFPQKKTIGIVM